MKLFLLSMIRNEADVLPSLLDHVGALFDSGCLVDHLSSDGSQESMKQFVAEREGWEYRPLCQPAYLQAEICTQALGFAFARGADAVFFLDADEFIAELDRAALEAAVERLEREQVLGHLRWHNCTPADYRVPFALEAPAWHCGPSEHKKVVVPRWIHRRHPGQMGINQGNHSLWLPDGEKHDEVQLGELLHFPIRSQRQLVQKILTSYLAQSSREDHQVARHVLALYETLTSKELTDELMNAIAADYGAPFALPAGLSHGEMRARGYRLETPRVARGGGR